MTSSFLRVHITILLLLIHLNNSFIIPKKFISTNLCASTSPLHSFENEDDENESCAIETYEDELSAESTKQIYLVSDNTGTLAKTALQSSLAQFDDCDDRFNYLFSENDKNIIANGCNIKTQMFNFVKNDRTLANIIKAAANNKAIVMFTMANPSLREKTIRMCELSDVPVIDLLGPTLSVISGFLNRTPFGLPQSQIKKEPNRISLSDSYFRRIEAIEFTLRADDGQAPWLLKDAEVILVGVSRTGKTPLSVIMSQTQGLKVANIPLVFECPVPKELFDISKVDPNRIFCLTIAPSELKRIRTSRLQRRNSKSNKFSLTEGETRSNYADRNYLMKDLKSAKDLSDKNGWTQVDVTGRAVEETASYICELLKERFDNNTLHFC